MTKRIQMSSGLTGPRKAMLALSAEAARAAEDNGLDHLLLELVKIRASQLNGCAFCLDMHTADAVKAGESPRRIFVLDAWREVDLFTDEERAALELTEAVTRLSETQDVPDDVYDRATSTFTEPQYQALLWSIVVINAWNRLSVTSRAPLPV
ncbi:carboxymuconolactone decarboxylase family protein [Umezawaea tangerina]|uniref:AhpD family alkylhydroperoxidase n=1 Tax=Umezawaea tangerina TaxID=84725 RepID=A0A2T0SE12_9PSEU|nr:AhpD family alkylhydroperoxidase [Umezawaea tangerina]